MNMLLNCAECRVDWVEVPIRTVYLNDRNTYSHFHPFKDSLRIYQSILKFSGSSFISFVLDYILFNIFSLFLGILSFRNPIFFSNILARVISCGFNYHLNKKYVFHSYGNHMKALKYFTLAFGILAAVITGINHYRDPCIFRQNYDGDHTFYRQYVGTTIPDIYA